MNFHFPLGLLGLIGIPIIVIIYIIKSKYTEQTVASTYLWELSEKFLKKRKPISKLTGIITLLLQCFAILFVSVAIAQPVFTVPASANDVYIILDGSASMNMKQGSSTRFEIAQKKANQIIDDSKSGSTYSLVFAGETTDVVFEGVANKEQAKVYIKALTASWTASDCRSAMTFAQNYYDSNRSAVMYLITDKDYEVNDALTLVDVSDKEQNYAFYSFEKSAGGVKGQVISYEADASINIELRGSKNVSDAPEKIGAVSVTAVKGEPADFEISASLGGFAKLELCIVNGDAMQEDNCVVFYDSAVAQDRKVLLISDTGENSDGVYLKNAIRYAGKAEVDLVTPEEYEKQGAASFASRGYGMYAFNGYTPDALPTNAAVWLIDAVDGSGGESGVSLRDYPPVRDETGPDSYFVPTYNEGSSALEKMLTKDLVRRRIAVRRYAQYSVPPRNFTSVLSVENDSIVFAGLNKNNDRQVVFAFRIMDSDFGMKDDFLILVRNLMDYSFPSVLSETSYVCGDTMAVSVVPGCEGIVLTSPSGKSSTLDTLGADVCEVRLGETGTYTLTVEVQGKDETKLYAYAGVPEEESRSAAGSSMLLEGEREYNYSDGFYDSLLPFLILIAVLIFADWGVYCYEQYQLR